MVHTIWRLSLKTGKLIIVMVQSVFKLQWSFFFNNHYIERTNNELGWWRNLERSFQRQIRLLILQKNMKLIVLMSLLNKLLWNDFCYTLWYLKKIIGLILLLSNNFSRLNNCKHLYIYPIYQMIVLFYDRVVIKHLFSFCMR